MAKTRKQALPYVHFIQYCTTNVSDAQIFVPVLRHSISDNLVHQTQQHPH